MSYKFNRLIIQLHRRLSPKQFIIYASILSGITAGIAAVTLKMLVHYVRNLVVHNINLTNYASYLYLFLPALGITASIFTIHFLFKNKFRKGIRSVLSAVKNHRNLPKENAVLQILTSAFTIGSGGSAGLEAPIVVTGSTIGSNYARLSRLDEQDRNLLIACGASAGIAAVFNAPIAGLIFSVEVLLSQIVITSFVPLLIASVCGALCSKIILDEQILFYFKLQQPFDYNNTLFYVALGILTGLISVYYSRTYRNVESFFNQNLPKGAFGNIIKGGIGLAALIFFFPPLFGEGYESIKHLADNDPEALLNNSAFSTFNLNPEMLFLYIAAIGLVKVIATCLTVSSGGNGGSFAPSLFIGGYTGFLFSSLINHFTDWRLPVTNFTLVGMAGILSAIFHAPLTAIFLIAEITGGYELMIPLMIISALSLGIKRLYEPHSMNHFEEEGIV